jgi:methionyl aminopeptidase
MNDMEVRRSDNESPPTRGRARAQIRLHDTAAFAGMRKAGRMAAELLDYIIPYVRPGISTGEVDRLCHDFVAERGGISAPLGYRGYPRSVCTSVNHVVCHGIPDDAKKLVDGDIVNIDVTPIVDGWHGDSSRMFYVGKPKIKARRLVEVTYECLMRAIDTVRPGATFGDIGHAIQSHAEANRFSVVRDFCGHGVSQIFHEPPNVLHFGEAGQGEKLAEGMIFTIEPMINAGRHEVKVLADGWTAVTKDRSLSAQFEHTIGVTADGCEVFTLSPKGYTCPPYAQD